MKKHMHAEVINRLGGTFEVARLCRVKPPSVSAWKKSGIPPAREQFLRLLRPDIFGPAPEGEREKEQAA